MTLATVRRLSKSKKHPFQAISEPNNPFLQLWPHRFDYIWAEHPTPGQRPNWKTECRHPLSDRGIQKGKYLYGVRFGPTTQYCLLDIDWGSYYHPQRDPFAIPRMLEALEPLGLARYVACTSSYSGGLHLYFPFSEALQTWTIGQAITTLLENAGFKLTPGQLEVFPNIRHYSPDGPPALFAAHRLPLQAGSYLLNKDWNPIWSSQETFVSQWRLAQGLNDINTKYLKQIIKQIQRKRYRISSKAKKFLNDLNTEIEVGWTGSGQTNRLLGRVALRSYIFGHVLYGSTYLEGQALIEDIINIAQSLPGFTEHCNHRRDLAERAAEWARSVENSRYYHYGKPKIRHPPREKPDPKMSDPSEPSDPIKRSRDELNQERATDAQRRIQNAVEQLRQQGALPKDKTQRLKAIVTQGRLSNNTMYKYKELWDPDIIDAPPIPPPAIKEFPMPEPVQRNGSGIRTNLLVENACNALPSLASGSCTTEIWVESACKPSPALLAAIQAGVTGAPLVKVVLAEIQVNQKAAKAAAHIKQLEYERNQLKPSSAYIQKMKAYLESGDRILMAEAQQWFQAYRHLIDPDQGSPP